MFIGRKKNVTVIYQGVHDQYNTFCAIKTPQNSIFKAFMESFIGLKTLHVWIHFMIKLKLLQTQAVVYSIEMLLFRFCYAMGAI